jgi:hypothetical protein
MATTENCRTTPGSFLALSVEHIAGFHHRESSVVQVLCMCQLQVRILLDLKSAIRP